MPRERPATHLLRSQGPPGSRVGEAVGEDHGRSATRGFTPIEPLRQTRTSLPAFQAVEEELREGETPPRPSTRPPQAGGHPSSRRTRGRESAARP